jgi:hypothetical protein
LKRFSPFATLIGLALFALILSRVDLKTSLGLLGGASPSWVAAALLLLFPEILLKSLRIRRLAAGAGHRLGLGDAVKVYLSGQPLASVTPAKLGDVARVLLLSRRSGMDTPCALAVHVADKVLDLAALALLASIGLITLIADARQTHAAFTALAGIGVGVALMAAFLNRGWVKRFVKPVVLALAPEKVARALHSHGREFYRHFETFFLPLRRLSGPLLLSLLAWETAVARAWVCAMALGLPLGFWHLQWLLPVVIMVEFLPISIMGFGTREASLFMFFPAVAREGLVSFSLLTVVVGPLASALMGIPAAASLGSPEGRKA